MKYYIDFSTSVEDFYSKVTATYDFKTRNQAEKYLNTVIKINPNSLETFCFNAADEQFRQYLAYSEPDEPGRFSFDNDFYLDCCLYVALYNENQEGFDGINGEYEEMYYIGYSINYENDIIFEDNWNKSKVE